MKDRFFKMVSLGIKQFSDPYYQGFAAQLSFYFLLSIVPILLLISQVLTMVFKHDLEDAVGWLIDYFGNSPITKEIEGIVLGSGSGSGAMSIVFIFVAIWAASRAQFSLIRITNFTFSEGQSTGKGFIRDRIRAMKTMAIILILIIFAIVVLMYGNVILKLALKIFGKEAAAGQIWLILRWPIAIVLYFFMISYIYYVLPSEKKKYKEIIPGSIFAAIGLLLVTALYSNYVATVANYNVLYGSLATIVALLFWFYFLAWVLCLGVLFNKVWEDTKK